MDMDERIISLERSVRSLRAALTICGIALIATWLLAFTRNSQDEIVRARGLVIVDDQGRDRILIGAPIPQSRARLRTDLQRVEQTWARRFPSPQSYMGYYQNYRHSMHGILIMDQNGVDRLALGDSTPDPNIGRRIGPATGIQINDAQGFERSGYGLLTVQGKNRVVLGLDSNRGTEGVAISLFDDGSQGVNIYAGKNQGFFGFMPADSTNPAFTGIVLSRDRKALFRIGLDTSGAVIRLP